MRSLLPNDCKDLRVYNQIKWVIDAKRMRQFSKQLDSEKSTLHIALLMAFQRENKGQYTSLRELQLDQDHLAALLSSHQADQRAFILSDLSETRISMKESMVAQTQSVLSFQRESQTQIESRLRAIEKSSSNQSQYLKRLAEALENIREDLRRERTRLHQRFDSLEILERTTTIADQKNAFSQDTLSKIIRVELRNILNSMIDDTVGPERWKRERFERLSATISDDIGQSFRKDNGSSSSEEAEPETSKKKEFQAYPLIQSWRKPPERNHRMKKRSWKYCLLFGNLIIHITTVESITKFSNSRIITITAIFLPSSRLPMPAISAAFRLNTSYAGYWEIGPAFSVINIISKDAEIWEYIENGNLSEVQRLFKNRRVSIRDCDSGGNTLLHYASVHFQDEICVFLLSEGADPVAINSGGANPLDEAHFNLLKYALWDLLHRGDPSGIVPLIDTCRLLETDQYQFLDSMTEIVLPIGLFRSNFIEQTTDCINNLNQDPNAARVMTEWLNFFRERYPGLYAKNNNIDIYDILIAAMGSDFFSIGLFYLAYGTGMDVNTQFPVVDNWTALHLVLSFGRNMDPFLLKTKLRLLIHHGADLGIAASCGCSPFDLAQQNGILMTLLEVMEEFGLSPPEGAVINGYSGGGEQKEIEELEGDGGISTTIACRDTPEAGVGLRNRRPHTHV